MLTDQEQRWAGRIQRREDARKIMAIKHSDCAHTQIDSDLHCGGCRRPVEQLFPMSTVLELRKAMDAAKKR